MSYDNSGNRYSKGFGTLESVLKGTTDIEVNAETTNIYGTGVNDFAFVLCTQTIARVTFPTNSKLKTISRNAFYTCSQIESIDLSVCNQLISIGEEAFKECSKLSSVKFPSSLEIIDAFAFQKCSLSTVTLPKSMTTLGNSAFRANYKLTEVIFESDIKLEKIDRYVFTYTSLKRFDLPRSVNSITAVAFEWISAMKEITAIGNPSYIVLNGILCTSDYNSLIYCPPSLTTETIYAPNVKLICSEAFFYCKAKQVIIPDTVECFEGFIFYSSSITSLAIPNSVTKIGGSALQYCTNLVNVTLSNNLTTLPSQMFYGCKELSSIVIPESIKTIQSSCFYGCTKLSHVTLPSNITDLGGGAFTECPNLNLTFAPGSPLSIDKQFIIYSNAGTVICQYIGYNESEEILVPSCVKEIKSSAFGSKTSITSVEFESDDNLTSIQNSAFQGCTKLKSFNFPKSLASIGEAAFEGCSSLTEVHLYSKLKLVGKNAFSNCGSLAKVIFEDTSEALAINEYCFRGCASLNQLTLGEGTKSIGNSFAQSTTHLASLVLPSSLLSIGQNAFYESGICSITFRNSKSSMLTIGDKAFNNAYSLTSFEFLAGIEKIGIEAFGGTSLNKAELPGSLKVIDSRGFQNCKKLKSVSLPDDSLLSTIKDAFEGCTDLEEINCTNNFFLTTNGALFNKMQTNIVIIPPASRTMFFCVPPKVSTISPSAFYGCRNIVTITFPDDSILETIGARAFAECLHLKTINIPTCVKNVGLDTFKGCRSLLCGQSIMNNSPDFKEMLIKNAKLPIICLKDCSSLMTSVYGNKCSKNKTGLLVFILVVNS